MAFFQANPQRYPQYRATRRNGATSVGQLTVHTFECPVTWSLLTGATFLVRRPDPGSYHDIINTTGFLPLADYSAETWHAVPTNNWAFGQSFLMYAASWPTLPAATRQALIHHGARAAVRAIQWHRARGIEIPLRILTQAQAMRREPGFVSHAAVDPDRRSDPGAGFPWSDYFTEIRRLDVSTPGGGGTPPPTTPPPALTLLEEIMSTPAQRTAFAKELAREVWHGDEFQKLAADGIPAETPGQRLREIRRALAQERPRLTDIWRSARKAERLLPGRSGVGNNGELWPQVARLLDLPNQELSAEVDVPALIEELAAVLQPLPEDLAGQVVDELSNRLKEN